MMLFRKKMGIKFVINYPSPNLNKLQHHTNHRREES
jgi:hypothetical protein